jgi:mono/diheme cytochrome c family protein
MGLAFAVVATRGLEAQSAPPAPAAPVAGSAAPTPPPGPALVVINERCSTCHSTASVFNQRRSADDWAATVQLMVDRGADLTPDDMTMVIGYLATNFGPEPAKPAAK